MAPIRVDLCKEPLHSDFMNRRDLQCLRAMKVAEAQAEKDKI